MRPSTYTPRRAAQFFELISKGTPELHAARAVGTAVPTVRLWARCKPGFAEAYALARAQAKNIKPPTGRALRRWESMLEASQPAGCRGMRGRA